MRFLLIGDVVGRTGRKTLKEVLPEVKKEYKPDFIVLNGENLAGGYGITKKVFNEIDKLGIDVITSGNHIWDKKEVFQFIDEEPKLLRPANYPPMVAGRGYGIYEKNGKKVAVINLMGRVFMGLPLDCPFRKFDEIYEDIKDKADYIIVDFHGEATSEKNAFGYYVDGRASIVFGTHTHVPTADERILPNRTVYITDIGLTGAYQSVIGIEPKGSIKGFLTGLPQRYNVAKGEKIFNALFVEIENFQIEIKRIQIKIS